MNIVDFFKNLLNSLVGTSLERMKLINTMNQTFKDSYCSSGFKISIENDNNIKDSEFRDISQYILSNKPFIRQLMTLGFDTLIVTGKTSRKGMQYCLKSYTQLGGFSLE